MKCRARSTGRRSMFARRSMAQDTGIASGTLNRITDIGRGATDPILIMGRARTGKVSLCIQAHARMQVLKAKRIRGADAGPDQVQVFPAANLPSGKNKVAGAQCGSEPVASHQAGSAAGER